jgi:RNA-directed DNA polymerase
VNVNNGWRPCVEQSFRPARSRICRHVLEFKGVLIHRFMRKHINRQFAEPESEAALLSLFCKHLSFESLMEGYKNALKGNKKYKIKAINFYYYDMVMLGNLHKELHEGTYKPGEYTQFMVYEPKERLINAPAFRDKIVQFAVHQALCDVYGKIYVKHSYACLEGRGPHRCALKIQHNLQKCKRLYGDAWIIKADIKKYFYSIDRGILKKMLRKKIKDPKMLWLLDIIIDSSPEGEVGISLGCVTSQDLATIYLNELDQYLVRYLGCRYYSRFMDDIVVVLPSRSEAEEVLRKMRLYLAKKLNLQTNSKTKIFPLRQGVNACGYKIKTTHLELREGSKRAMKRRMKAMDRKVKSGQLTVKSVQQAVNSWIGHAIHCSSYSLIMKIFLPYDYIDREGVINNAGILGKSRK